MARAQVIPTAEPFFFKGGPIGCLLVHGFTGTPKEMRWMGEDLAGRGCTVMGIRLAGHATTPSDMVRTRWHDWLASVEDGLDMLRPNVDHLFIAGLSMGGALSLLATARHPVDGVIAMSAPVTMPEDWRMRFLGVAQYVMPEVEKGPPDWRNPEAAAGHISYPRYPTPSVRELNQLLKVVLAELPNIDVPALLFHSRLDEGVNPENMPIIYERISSQDRQMIWLENSGHVITREPERQMVFDRSYEFMCRIAGI